MNDLKTLERLMIERGLTIRAIPKEYKETWSKYADNCNECKRNKDNDKKMNRTCVMEFNNNKEFCVFTRKPKNGGKFLIVDNCGNGSMIRFDGKKYFDSINDIIEDLQKYDKY
jgi:hypothetical protein